MTDRHGAAPGGGPGAGDDGAVGAGRRHEGNARRLLCTERRRYARSVSRALDLLMYGERKQTDPRPGCRAAMAHLKDHGLWGEISYRTLADVVADWQAGR